MGGEAEGTLIHTYIRTYIHTLYYYIHTCIPIYIRMYVCVCMSTHVFGHSVPVEALECMKKSVGFDRNNGS